MHTKAHRNKPSVLFMIILGVSAVIVMAPVLLMMISSLTDETVLIRNGYSFLPAKWSIEAYRSLFSHQAAIFQAYGNSVLVTLCGTTVHVVLSVLYAYPLMKRDFKYRRLFLFIAFFTMLFNGGIVPSYILWSRFFQVRNTIWALILPNYLMNGFNIILLKNFYEHSIPYDIIEAAEIDGASEFVMLRKVVVPLSAPVITTVALFAGIIYWNDWINGLYYINKRSLFSIQQLLTQIMNNIQFLHKGSAVLIMGTNYRLPTVSYRMAIATIGVLPVIIIVPFLQKQLIRGMVIGAVKG